VYPKCTPNLAADGITLQIYQYHLITCYKYMRSEHTGYVVPDIPVQASIYLNTKPLCAWSYVELMTAMLKSNCLQIKFWLGFVQNVYSYVTPSHNITNSDRTNCI